MGVIKKLLAAADAAADKKIAKSVDAVVDENDEVARRRGKPKTDKQKDDK